jgi:hypothetical protein
LCPEIPGFRVKYSGIEVEFYSTDQTTVANKYREVLEWLKSTVQKTLDHLELEIVQLKEDLTDIKAMRKEA